jgi:hypothetical protein
MNLITLLFFSLPLFSQVTSRDKSLSEFFSKKTKIDNPLELRDPFKAPFVKGDGSSKKKSEKNTSGIYTNVVEKTFNNLILSDLKVIGVLIGKERRALVHPNESSKEVLILKEGMQIGPDKAELKAILPGGIILVEKIINVYGQEEYLETVIPISR